ncbi:MAG: DUF4105 domain-containing protein [Gallionellaceae bacterium]
MAGYAEWGRNPIFSELNNYSKVSLGFASQNLRSAISIFGHTFLVFHNEEAPEANSLLVEFTGEAPDLSSSLSALFLSVPGKYSLNYLAEKRREYDGENRSLWLYRLSFNEERLHQLKQFLLQSEREKYLYDFSQKNCAFYIAKALEKSGKELRFGREIFVSPVNTLRWTQAANMIVSATYLPSTQLRATLEYDALSPSQQQIIENYFKYSPTQNLSDGANKNAISVIAEHLIPSEGDANRRNFLFALKREFPISAAHTEMKAKDPARSPSAGLLSAQWLPQKNAALVSISPGFINLDNEAFFDQKNATVQVLKTVLMIEGAGRVSLNQFQLINIESNQPSEYLREGFTQAFDMSYTNYRMHLNKNYAENKLTFGRGVSYFIGSHVISALPLGAVVFSSQDSGSSSLAQIEMRLNLYKQLTDKTAYTIQITQSTSSAFEIKQTVNLDLVSAIGKGQSVSFNARQVSGAEQASTLTGIRLTTAF